MFSFILYDANNLFGRVVITHFYFYYFYKLLYFLKCNYLTLLFVLSIVSLWISSLLRRRKTKFQNGGAILYSVHVHCSLYAGPPEPPSECQVLNQTQAELAVECRLGYRKWQLEISHTLLQNHLSTVSSV